MCGLWLKPTVKAHLFPRALMLDAREGSTHLVEGNRRRDGVTYRQNGPWDDRYVCKRHEDECGAGDTYFVELCRRVDSETKPVEGGGAVALPNPRPDLLLHFAYSMVWRQVVCPEGQRLKLELGPYRQLIESTLFSGDKAELPLLVTRSKLLAGRVPAKIAIAPYRQRLGDWRIWHFSVAGLEFYLKTDRKTFPQSWSSYVANGSGPLIMPVGDPLDAATVPLLQDIFRRMSRK